MRDGISRKVKVGQRFLVCGSYECEKTRLEDDFGRKRASVTVCLGATLLTKYQEGVPPSVNARALALITNFEGQRNMFIPITVLIITNADSPTLNIDVPLVTFFDRSNNASK